MILVAAQNTFNQNESLGADFFPHLNFHLLFHIFLPVAAFIQLKVYVRRVYIRGKCKLCSFIILFAFSLVWDMMYIHYTMPVFHPLHIISTPDKIPLLEHQK